MYVSEKQIFGKGIAGQRVCAFKLLMDATELASKETVNLSSYQGYMRFIFPSSSLIVYPQTFWSLEKNYMLYL